MQTVPIARFIDEYQAVGCHFGSIQSLVNLYRVGIAPVHAHEPRRIALLVACLVQHQQHSVALSSAQELFNQLDAVRTIARVDEVAFVFARAARRQSGDQSRRDASSVSGARRGSLPSSPFAPCSILGLSGVSLRERFSVLLKMIKPARYHW